MNLNVQLFAAARDAAGESPLPVCLPDAATVADLRHQLVEQCPALQPMSDVLLVAVNNEYAADDRPLQAADSIACFPPVSGG